MLNDLTQFENVLFVLTIPFIAGLAFGVGMMLVVAVFWMIFKFFTRGDR